MSNNILNVCITFILYTGFLSGIAAQDEPFSGPDGYYLIDGRHPLLLHKIEQFVPSINRLLAAYIPDEEVPMVMNDEKFIPRRRCLVQVLKEHDNVPPAQLYAEFRDTKDFMVNNYNDISSSIPSVTKPFLNEMINSSNPSIPQGMVDVLEYDRAVGMKPHDVNDNYICWTLISKFRAGVAGAKNDGITVTTSGIIYFKSRIYYLFAHGEKEDLLGTRNVIKQWVSAIFSGLRK